MNKLNYSANLSDLSKNWVVQDKQDSNNNNNEQPPPLEMGSNVSRAGLAERRAQSSGNLCQNAAPTTRTTTPKKNKKDRKGSKYSAGVDGNAAAAYDNASFTDPCIVNDISLQQLYSPERKSYDAGPRQALRQAYHGSLPNNLDVDEIDGMVNQQGEKAFFCLCGKFWFSKMTLNVVSCTNDVI